MKKALKKLSAAVLSAAMVVSCIPCIANAASDAMVFFSTDYEDYSVGASPRTDWELSVGNNTCKIVENEHLGSKGVYFLNTAGGDLYLQKSTISYPKNSKIGFSADIMVENTAENSAVLFRLRDSAAVFVDLVKVSGGSVKLFDGTEIARISANTPVSIDVLVDFTEKTADAFVNGKKKASGVSFASTKFDIPVLFRMMSTGSVSKHGLYMDNIYVYASDSVLSDEQKNQTKNATKDDVIKKMYSSVALYENRTTALAFGKQLKNVPYPRREDGTLYIPVRFVAELYGADVTYDNATETAKIVRGDKTATVGENADINGKIFDGSMCAEAEGFSEFLGQTLFVDECGLIVITDKEELFDWNHDLNLMNETVRQFIYTDYTGAEIVEKLTQTHPDNAHPRIMATQETFEKIKEKIKIDAQYKGLYETCIATAENLLDVKPVQYSSDVQAQLEVSRSALSRITSLAMAYKLSGEEKYAARCYKEMEAVCGQETWLGQFLSVGEMSAAIAIGYDWTYDYLNEEQKQLIEKAVVEKAITPTEEALSAKQFWVSGAGVNNWSFVCWGGVSMAALAICDRTESERCGEIVAEMAKNLPDALKLYAPDGAWEEGTVYWNYTMKYHAFLISTLDSALGDDLGLFDVPGIRKTCDTQLALIGSNGKNGTTFNFSDSNESTLNSLTFSFLAQKLGRPEYAKKRMESSVTRQDGEFDMLWLVDIDAAEDVDMPLDTYMRGIETVTMRSSNSASAMYFGMHTGDNAATHSHLDMGTFILDSQGERFFCDYGQDNYDLSAKSKQLYRGKAEGHNCVFIVTDEIFDQSASAICTIDKFETSEKGAYAISDITAAYSFIATKYERGIKLDDDRTRAIVQDEIVLSKPADLYWCSQTKADTIELSEDNRRAVLTINGKKLLAKILSEGGTFEVTDAVTLNPEQRDAAEYKNPGAHKLAIYYPQFEEGTISVGFTPIYGDESDSEFGEVVPLAAWTVSEGSFAYAETDGIYIDGVLVEGFESDNYSYTYEIPADSEEIPVVTAGENAVVHNAEEFDGTAVIEVSEEGKRTMYYTVSFHKEEILGVPDGYEQIHIVEVTASDSPQAAQGYSADKTIDGDLDTRWAAENECNLVFDLGESCYFDTFSMAQMLGDRRTSHFVIEVSNDGRHWTKQFEGDTSGTTADPEMHEIGGVTARYIRLNLFGTSTGSWNSVNEVFVLKKK